MKVAVVTTSSIDVAALPSELGTTTSSIDIVAPIISQSTATTVMCSVCCRNLSKRSALNRHMETVHNASRARIFKCSVCSANFKRRDIMQRHKMIHNKLGYIKCKGCGKKFRPDFLQPHLQASANSNCLEEYKDAAPIGMSASNTSGVPTQSPATEVIGIATSDGTVSSAYVGSLLSDSGRKVDSAGVGAVSFSSLREKRVGVAQTASFADASQDHYSLLGHLDDSPEDNLNPSNHHIGCAFVASSQSNVSTYDTEPVTSGTGSSDFCPWDEYPNLDWADRFWFEGDIDASFDEWTWGFDEYV